MKILFTAYVVDSHAGSEAQMAWFWIRSAALAGHEVNVLTTPEYAEKLNIVIKVAGFENVRVLAVPTTSRLSMFPFEFEMYLTYLIWQRSLRRYIDEYGLGECDLGHHTSWGNLGLGSGFARTQIPYVFGPAGGGTIANPKLRYFYGKEYKIEVARSVILHMFKFMPFSRRSARNSTIMLATNRPSSNLAKNLGAKNVKLFLADSIDAEQIFAVKQPKEKIVLFVARFMPRKGAVLAICGFSKVLQRFPDARLVMIGDGPLLEQTIATANKLGVIENVEFTGKLPWVDVQKYYAESSVFLFTSLRDSFGAQVMEAAAKGLPVVALEGGGAAEWVPKNGIWLAAIAAPSETIQNIADQICSVFELKADELEEVSHSLREFAQENSTLAKGRDMQKIYEEVSKFDTKR